MDIQANLGVWEDPHGPWSEQEPSKAGEHQGQGVQVRQGGVLSTAPDPNTPWPLPFPSQGSPAAPDGGRLQGQLGVTAGSVHPASISSRAPGVVKADLSSL